MTALQDKAKDIAKELGKKIEALDATAKRLQAEVSSGDIQLAGEFQKKITDLATRAGALGRETGRSSGEVLVFPLRNALNDLANTSENIGKAARAVGDAHTKVSIAKGEVRTLTELVEKMQKSGVQDEHKDTFVRVQHELAAAHLRYKTAESYSTEPLKVLLTTLRLTLEGKELAQALKESVALPETLQKNKF